MQQVRSTAQHLARSTHELQAELAQQRALYEQQRRADREEFSAEMRKMRQENAAMHQERSAAYDTALTIEGQKQVAIHDAELQHRSDRARLQQVETTAEHAYASAEHKLTMTNRELESDRELHATNRLREAQLRNQLVQVETHANEHFALLSGALCSTEEGQVVSHQLYEGHYQQHEAQLRDQWQAE